MVIRSRIEFLPGRRGGEQVFFVLELKLLLYYSLYNSSPDLGDQRVTEIHSTVIYDDVATELSARCEAGQLWIDSGDLSRATRFELKPQGVCRDELCYPLPQSGQSEFLRDE